MELRPSFILEKQRNIYECAECFIVIIHLKLANIYKITVVCRFFCGAIQRLLRDFYCFLSSTTFMITTLLAEHQTVCCNRPNYARRFDSVSSEWRCLSDGTLRRSGCERELCPSHEGIRPALSVQSPMFFKHELLITAVVLYSWIHNYFDFVCNNLWRCSINKTIKYESTTISVGNMSFFFMALTRSLSAAYSTSNFLRLTSFIILQSVQLLLAGWSHLTTLFT